jgi:aerobic carbon-monoxide dehydrogenase medium subunit
MSVHSQYARPGRLEQALELLAGLGPGAMVFAGGQELMPHLNYGRLSPAVIVDVGRLAELRGIEQLPDGRLSIGALTVHREVQQHPLVRAHARVLAAAAGEIGGGWQVHNRGTIGGNIASMHPLYDILPPLVALGAWVELASVQGRTQIALTELLRRTDHGLGVSSLLTRVLIPTGSRVAAGAYYKLKIVEGAYGSANAAVQLVLGADGVIESLRAAIGAVSERLVVPDDACQQLVGRVPDTRTLREFSDACAAAVIEPLSDQRGHAQYRQAMAGVAAGRALEAALRELRADVVAGGPGGG